MHAQLLLARSWLKRDVEPLLIFSLTSMSYLLNLLLHVVDVLGNPLATDLRNRGLAHHIFIKVIIEADDPSELSLSLDKMNACGAAHNIWFSEPSET